MAAIVMEVMPKVPSINGTLSAVASKPCGGADVFLVEAILDKIEFGVIVLDAMKCVVLWNGWLEKMSGIHFDAVQGRCLEEIFPQLADSRVPAAVQTALNHGFPSVLSQSLNKSPFPLTGKVSPKGEKVAIQQKINVLPLRLQNAARSCLIEIYDVSLAVLREKALAEQKNFLHAILESEPDCVTLLAPDHGVLQINGAGLAMLELQSLESARQTRFIDFVMPANRNSFDELARQVFSGGGGRLELQIESRHGKRRWLEISAAPLYNAQKKVTALIAVGRDTTERLQQQAVDRLFHMIDQKILQGYPKRELFAYICAEVARIFGYPFVWIGDKLPGGAVAISASGGPLENPCCAAIQHCGVRWDTQGAGQGPAGLAIRSGQIQVCETGAAGSVHWCKLAELQGMRSCLSIPLILRGDVFGSFNLASVDAHDFADTGVVRRLSEIADRIRVAQERANDHEQLRLLETALSTAANGVFIADRFGRLQWLNAAFVKITGYDGDEVLGGTPHMLQTVSGEGFFREMPQSLAAGEAWSGESVERRKDGRQYHLRQTITPIRDANGAITHFISILEDVTATRAAEERIKHMAHYDDLTDLPNRALFHERLKLEVARARRGSEVLALMFLDLDNFKAVNDVHGHDVGDLLLKEVACRLKTCVRESDTVARLGGDEFTILLPAVPSSENVTVVADKIFAVLGEVFHLSGCQLRAGASIGIALFPHDAIDEDNLIRRADTAMYAAKRAGRGAYSFFSDQQA